jgi:hypothetical protein
VGKPVWVRGPTFGTDLSGSGGLANDIPIPGIYKKREGNMQDIAAEEGTIGGSISQGAPRGINP